MDEITNLLTRGVDNILPEKKELEKILRTGKKLRVYQGFDPSTSKLHLGHFIGLRKLKQWQELDHEVIFLIGDFTARIGDPTGKEKTRPLLSKAEVDKNAQGYKTQASSILNFEGKNPVKIKFNSEWLDKLKMPEMFNLASQVTYQQIIKRDMFKKRIETDQEISFNEILYPIMQGYDSVAMNIDVEIGGRDQLFNMMIGRDLMHKMKRKNKFVMTTQLLTDSLGNKIGKTTGNSIDLTDPPDKIFGAVMNFPDDVIVKGLEFLTDTPVEEISAIETEIKNRQNPMPYKKLLAFEVVKQLNGEVKAKSAQAEFEKIFQKGSMPQDAVTIAITSSSVNIVDFLVENKIVESRSQAKRLLAEGALELDSETINNNEVEISNNQVLKIGKRKFAKIIVSSR